MAIWSAGCPTDIISKIVGGVRGNCAPDLSLLAITFVAIITTVPYVSSVHSWNKDDGTNKANKKESTSTIMEKRRGRKQGIEISQFLERPESTMTFE